MIEKSLYIVIPVHNRKDFTHSCLLSLYRQTLTNFKIIVIDDGSTDGTSEMIQKEFPEVILLHGDGNLWFTAATNLGVRYALREGASYVLVLNDDTIAEEDFIEKMMVWAGREPTALLGALALDVRTTKAVYGGEIINWKTAGSTFLLDILKLEEQHGLHEVTHYPTRGLLIPAEAFYKVGLFDEKNFPQAGSDYDFTHRAVRAGYKVFCNYDAKLLMYPDESGDVKLRKSKSLKNYYYHLFGLKGGGNLKRFTIYTIRNCPRKYFLIYLTIGIFRRIFGYLQDWSLETLKSLFYPNKQDEDHEYP